MPFLPKRMKIDKTKKLVCNLRDKKKYVVHISILKQALNHGLKLKKVHRVIEFNQEAWLKKYIDMNTELRKKASNDFEKDFFKLMNNAVFGKTMENVRKHRDIKLVKTYHKRNKLVSEPNYHTMKLISENLSIIELKKVKVKMKKPIYLGLSILEISKIIMYEFWYDYVKKKYGDMVKLCYMDTDSLVMRYSIEPRERRYAKGYGFMSFARNFSDKYSKYLMDKGIDVSKKFAKAAGKKILKETAKATGDLIGNKIADKITSASKKSHDEVNNEVPKERYIYPKERQKIIDELKLT